MTYKSVLFSYVTNTYTHLSLLPGIYKFELWGASGDDEDGHNYSRGAYVGGVIRFNEMTDIYLYIGECGSRKTQGSFNGGGSGSSVAGHSGGGATDIRLVPGSLDSINSLLSRIIIAAGGGGTARNHEYVDDMIVNNSDNSNAGGLIGEKGELRLDEKYPFIVTNAEGGTQQIHGQSGKCTTSGCQLQIPSDAKFGIGGCSRAQYGGGGYFGGGAGYVSNGLVGGGAGGSSFVSGCDGCVAISEKSSFSNIIPLNSNIHYSNKSFSSIIMKSGNEEFLNPYGTKEKGHFGHGSIKITFLSYSCCDHCTHLFVVTNVFLFIFIFK